MSKTKIERIQSRDEAFAMMLRIVMRLHATPSMASKLPKQVLNDIYAVWLWHTGRGL